MVIIGGPNGEDSINAYKARINDAYQEASTSFLFMVKIMILNWQAQK